MSLVQSNKYSRLTFIWCNMCPIMMIIGFFNFVKWTSWTLTNSTHSSFEPPIVKTEHYLFVSNDCTCATVQIKCQISNSFEATSGDLGDLTLFISTAEHKHFVIEHQWTRFFNFSIVMEVEVQFIVSTRRINRQSLLLSSEGVYRQNNWKYKMNLYLSVDVCLVRSVSP